VPSYCIPQFTKGEGCLFYILEPLLLYFRRGKKALFSIWAPL
jgi:hypothetical protein